MYSSRISIFLQDLRAAVNKHVHEQLTSHLMDMSKAFAAVIAKSSDTGTQRTAPRRTRGGMEARPQEQTSHEGYLSELSTESQLQRNEIDEVRRVNAGLSSTVQHLERRQEEARMRQERSIQELTLR